MNIRELHGAVTWMAQTVPSADFITIIERRGFTIDATVFRDEVTVILQTAKRRPRALAGIEIRPLHTAYRDDVADPSDYVRCSFIWSPPQP